MCPIEGQTVFKRQQRIVHSYNSMNPATVGTNQTRVVAGVVVVVVGRGACIQ